MTSKKKLLFTVTLFFACIVTGCTSNPGEQEESQDKYLGGTCNHIISKYIPQFLVICTPQGDAELSDRN